MFTFMIKFDVESLLFVDKVEKLGVFSSVLVTWSSLLKSLLFVDKIRLRTPYVPPVIFLFL